MSTAEASGGGDAARAVINMGTIVGRPCGDGAAPGTGGKPGLDEDDHGAVSNAPKSPLIALASRGSADMRTEES